MARIVPAALALLLGTALVAGCSNDSDDPLKYADDAIASSADLGAATLTGARLHDDIALVPDEGRLAAIDLSTGQSTWSADDGEPLLGGDGAVADHRGTESIQPVIRETGDDDWQVLITYRKPVGEVPADRSSMYSIDFAYGIAALSGDDGHVEWLSEAVVQDTDVEPEVRPLFADEETVVAASVQGTEAEGLTAWAFDAESGETRWSQRGVWPSALSGDVVTVEEGATDATIPWSQEGPERENATVRAVDAATGESEWDVSEEFDTSIADAASDDYIVIRGSSGEGNEDGDEDRTVLVDPETGKAVEEIGGFELCYASEEMIACKVDGELLTFRSEDDELRADRSGPLDSSSTWDIKSVIGQTVFIQEVGGGEAVHAFDAEGKTRAEELPAAPADLNDAYGVFCDGAECQGVRGRPG